MKQEFKDFDFFCVNIRHLRSLKGRCFTQDVVSGALGISRSTLNSYENGSIKNPSVPALIMFSKYYKISIENLIRHDLHRLSDLSIALLNQKWEDENKQILKTNFNLKPAIING